MQKLNDNPILNLNPRMQLKVSPQASSRILYDIPCKVCTDHSSGKHYGIFACDGCAGFFKRSIRRNRQYVCKAKIEGTCIVDKTHRNQCRACRLAKCQEAGMNKDAVQHERGPRNSTIRRQMAIYFKDSVDSIPTSVSNSGHINSSILDLAVAKNPSMLFPCLNNVTNSILSASASAATSNNNGFLYNPFSYTELPLPFTSAFLFSPSLNIETVRESAARLLFMNVKWTENLPEFISLPIADQLLLLEESWRELFILGTAQFLLPLDLATLAKANSTIKSNNNNNNNNNNEKPSSEFMNEIKIFQETLYKFAQLQIDFNEYSFLRVIVLFKNYLDKLLLPSSNSSTSSLSNDSNNSSIKTLMKNTTISNIHEQTQLALNKYITNSHPGQPLRFGKILLILPSLRLISSHTIEELFFRKTIGNIPIEKIISDMYKPTIN